ncbi:hypothetical protein RYX36_006953 [Vicia faba]
MEVATADVRRWDELIPDTLGVIFTKLPLRERLTVIPRVCKSWASAVNGPYCWQEIDIYDWCTRCEARQIERMVEMLVTRSSGSLRKLCASGLQTERIFTFIAENAGSLKNLRLPRCDVNDFAVEQMTRKLSMICILDLSYCIRIGSKAIETIGKNCKCLEVFCRNMHPLDTSGKPLEDAEAFAVASTMPKLKSLEMTYNLITNEGVYQILSLCPNLEHLDLRGCWGVKLDNMYVKQSFPKLNILGPQVSGYYEREECSDISDSSDSEYDNSDMDEYDFYDDESDDGMWYHDGRIDELEFRVYEGGIEDAAMYWPPSP